jgi:hypothetical protein
MSDKQRHDGGPAFPQALQGRRGDDPEYQGMTLRDYFAGQAISGISESIKLSRMIANEAYQIADAMLKERAKENHDEQP